MQDNDKAEMERLANPYAAPQTNAASEITAPALKRGYSIARVYKIIGCTGIVISSLIVFSILIDLIDILLGNLDDAPPDMVLAGSFYGALFVLAINYVQAGKRIAALDLTVRNKAIMLSLLLLLGIPLLTIVGAYCYRTIKHDFDERILVALTA